MADQQLIARLPEILAAHGKWWRGGDGGVRANLCDADLFGANLGWTVAGHGPIAQWLATYWWLTIRDKDGVRWLKFGCEARTLDQWDAEVAALCAQHEPTRAARYEAEIRALVALCRTLDMEESMADQPNPARAALMRLRDEFADYLRLANKKDVTGSTQAVRSELDGRIAAYRQCLSDTEKELAALPAARVSDQFDDGPLRRFVEHLQTMVPITPAQGELALAELCRRALR